MGLSHVAAPQQRAQCEVTGKEQQDEGPRLRALDCQRATTALLLLLCSLMLERIAYVVSDPVLMPQNLAIKLVHQSVDRRIHVFFRCLRMNAVATHPKGNLRSLP